MLTLFHSVFLMLGMILLIVGLIKQLKDETSKSYESKQETLKVMCIGSIMYFTAFIIAVLRVLTGDLLSIILVILDAISIYYIVDILSNINKEFKKLIQERKYLEAFQFVLNNTN